MKRLSTSLLFAVLLLLGAHVPLGHAMPMRGAVTPITRAEFLQEAVTTLYGTDIEAPVAPYAGIPDTVSTAMGVARVLGAAQEWGNQAQWNAPVRRGEALTILLTLAQVKVSSGRVDRFTDLRTVEAQKVVEQAFLWNLMEPLTKQTFGWSRVLSASELPDLLQKIQEHVQMPLQLPAEGARLGTTRSRVTPVRPAVTAPRRVQPVDRGADPTKKTIIIEMGSVSGGGSVRNVPSTLPRKDLLESVWGLVQDKFLYEDRIDQNALAYAMAETLLKELNDPYTTFLKPRTNERFQQQISGDTSFSGIGAHVRLHQAGGVEIVSPLPGSPAMRAGVRPGDRVLAVDDVSVVEMALDDAVSLIRGPRGSIVRLLIDRAGAGGSMVISVTRDDIVLHDLTVKEQDGIAIVTIANFSRTLSQTFNAAMHDLMQSSPKGLILDMRNNPGGLLDGAVLVASHFLPENRLIVTVARRSFTEEYRAVGGVRSIPADLPVVVLVNKGSASASEIVAGALQDHDRAIIIGQTTFGKGTVQEAVEFPAASGETAPAAKLTVAKWLTPKGQEIEGKGVTPDIELPEQESGGRDEALLKALSILQSKIR